MDQKSHIGTLRFKFLSPWRFGTGKSGGGLALSTYRDQSGLPRIPGVAIRGIIRSHAEVMRSNGLISKNLIQEQFGLPFSEPGQPFLAKGVLVFSDAKPMGSTHGKEVFSIIPHIWKGAVTHCIEVVSPMVLESLVIGNDDSERLLCEVSPRVTAIGALRAQGFGQVNLEFFDGSSFS